MKLRLIFCVCALLGCCNFAAAQKSTNLRPKWVGNTPKDKDASFYFVEVGSDASLSLEAARASVKKELATNVERTDKVSVSEVYEDKSTQKYSGGNASMQSTDSYQLKLNVDGTARPITSRRIDEYWRTVHRGGVPVLDYHALYAVERKGASADFSNVYTVSSYGARGLWRSMIIPGWGQFHKGANLKGGLILGGTAVLAGGIVFTENQRSGYVRRMNETHDVRLIKSYKTKRDNFATCRNICIGAAAALYLYNLIDAVAAPGARRVVVRRRADGRSYAFMPAVAQDGTPVMTAAITF